jgi:hypothetical protein
MILLIFILIYLYLIQIFYLLVHLPIVFYFVALPSEVNILLIVKLS